MHKGRETPKGNLEKIGNESKNETESKKKVSARKHIHSGHTIRKLEKTQNRGGARDGVPPIRTCASLCASWRSAVSQPGGVCETASRRLAHNPVRVRVGVPPSRTHPLFLGCFRLFWMGVQVFFVGGILKMFSCCFRCHFGFFYFVRSTFFVFPSVRGCLLLVLYRSALY